MTITFNTEVEGYTETYTEGSTYTLNSALEANYVAEGVASFFVPTNVKLTGGALIRKTVTELADADATLTPAQIVGGIFVVAVATGPIVLTTPSAVHILEQLDGEEDNTTFEVTVVNLAAEDVTIEPGDNVSIVGSQVVNNASATWIVRRVSFDTIEMYRK